MAQRKELQLTKICKVCVEEKPKTEFRGGRECRTCRNTRRRAERRREKGQETPKDRIARHNRLRAKESTRAARMERSEQERTNAARRKYTRGRKHKVQQILAKSGCVKCGEDDLRVLVFHHRDSSEKVGSPCQMAIHFAWAKVEIEMVKCDVLCQNCHAKEHYRLEEDGYRTKM